MRYYAKRGGRYSDEDARILGPFLHELKTPKKVVGAARKKNHPAHPYFEWDDSVAAELHREETARSMFRHIEIDIIDSTRKKRRIRAFHNVTVYPEDDHEESEKTGERMYLPIQVVSASDDLSNQVVARAHDGFLSWRRLYFSYREVFKIPGLKRDLDAAQKKLGKARKTKKKRGA